MTHALVDEYVDVCHCDMWGRPTPEASLKFRTFIDPSVVPDADELQAFDAAWGQLEPSQELPQSKGFMSGHATVAEYETLTAALKHRDEVFGARQKGRDTR